MITTPGHGSYPSGHGTQAYAIAYVLEKLLFLPDKSETTQQLQRQAARIATNRVIAGVHFPIDSIAGRMLGTALGEYVVAKCEGGEFKSRTLNVTHLNKQHGIDFNPFDDAQGLENSALYESSYSLTSATKSNLMAHLWSKAREEWRGRFGVGSQKAV
jgi:hypothetical protein